MTIVGKYNMSRFAVTGADANHHWLAAATGGRRFATVLFWEASGNRGDGAPYTGYEAIYLIAVDGHPCWVLISESESPSMVVGANEVNAIAQEMSTCPECIGGTHRRPREVTAYPDRDEPHRDFVARVRAMIDR